MSWAWQFIGFNVIVAVLAAGAGHLVGGGDWLAPTASSAFASILLIGLGGWCLFDARGVTFERARPTHGQEFGLHRSTIAAVFWFSSIALAAFAIALVHSGPAGLNGAAASWRDVVVIAIAAVLSGQRALLAPMPHRAA